jgi:hypothetical protein
MHEAHDKLLLTCRQVVPLVCCYEIPEVVYGPALQTKKLTFNLCCQACTWCSRVKLLSPRFCKQKADTYHTLSHS